MKKILIVTVISSLLTLTGCSQAQFDNFNKSVGNIIYGNATDANETKSTQKTIGNTNGELTVDTSVDVDTVFAAIKNEFGFPSPSDLKRKHGEWQANLMTQDAAYYYETNPGAFYHVGFDSIKNNADYLNLNCKIQKNSKGTKVICKYWDGSVNTKKELIARIKNAIR